MILSQVVCNPTLNGRYMGAILSSAHTNFTGDLEPPNHFKWIGKCANLTHKADVSSQPVLSISYQILQVYKPSCNAHEKAYIVLALTSITHIFYVVDYVGGVLI